MGAAAAERHGLCLLKCRIAQLSPHRQQAHQAESGEQGRQLEGHVAWVAQLFGDHFHVGHVQERACAMDEGTAQPQSIRSLHTHRSCKLCGDHFHEG